MAGASRPAGRRSSTRAPSARDARRGATRSRLGRAAAAVSGERAVSTRRVAVLAVVLCALVLTLAVPLRTYVAQRQELAEVVAAQQVSRAEVADLTRQKTQLQDPAYVAAQARERLRYVAPGETPYQVQLPDDVARSTAPAVATDTHRDPWYSELWGSITAPAP